MSNAAPFSQKPLRAVDARIVEIASGCGADHKHQKTLVVHYLSHRQAGAWTDAHLVRSFSDSSLKNRVGVKQLAPKCTCIDASELLAPKQKCGLINFRLPEFTSLHLHTYLTHRLHDVDVQASQLQHLTIGVFSPFTGDSSFRIPDTECDREHCTERLHPCSPVAVPSVEERRQMGQPSIPGEEEITKPSDHNCQISVKKRSPKMGATWHLKHVSSSESDLRRRQF